MSDWADYAPLSPEHVTDPERVARSLAAIVECGISDDLLQTLWSTLAEHLHLTDTPDESIDRLSQFIRVSRSPMALLALFERDPMMLPALLQVLSTSPAIAKLLINDPESFDLIRASDGSPAQRSVLIDELTGEMASIQSPRRASFAIRRFASREILRIAYGEFVRGLSPDKVQSQISFVTDAILEAALGFAIGHVSGKRAIPQRIDGSQPTFSIIALGNYGGQEIGYESQLDLLLLCDQIDRKNASHVEFHRQVAVNLVEILQSHGSQVIPFTLRFDHQPTRHEVSFSDTQRLGVQSTRKQSALGRRTAIEPSRDLDFFGISEAATHYERNGRTWQRLAFVKARHAAGDESLSKTFLQRIEPWVYHHLLTRSEIADIRVLRRKLEKRAHATAASDSTPIADVPGGRRDIEFTIQFLQLLHGSDLPDVRVTGTLPAINELSRHGCLTSQEASILSNNHAKLCRLEHLLAVLFDHRISHLPDDPDVRARLAWRLGVRTENQDAVGNQSTGDAAKFEKMLQETFDVNRKIINHLMVDEEPPSEFPASGSDGEEASESPDELQQDFALITELILDPDPDMDVFQETIARYQFTNVPQAISNVIALSQETVSFLSPRRCRHFFAAVAPRVLQEISASPDPDSTLARLVAVTDSIGAKATLWELLRTNDATLSLTISMCSLAPYLTNILIDHPGMIDELIDSLVMDRLPTKERLDAQTLHLCDGVEEIVEVLRHVKASAHLMIGVRDLLGKESIDSISLSLTDTAEASLRRVMEREQELLAQRYGDPMDAEGNPAELVAVALGRFAGGELNYHSDLDLTFVYTSEGDTKRRVGGPRSTLSNRQFFNQLAQNILRRMDQTPEGRLYEMDLPFAGGADESVLAMSCDQFLKPFRQRTAPLWQLVTLCKSRPISGSREAREMVGKALQRAIQSVSWRESMFASLRDWRDNNESTAGPSNLKRGAGGLLDVELVAASGIMQHAKDAEFQPHSNTIQCLQELRKFEEFSSETIQTLIDNYRFLRVIEDKLRLLNTVARHELPHELDDADATLELEQLARLTQHESPAALIDHCDKVRKQNRELLNRLVPLGS
ncbi:glutamate-ammonia-ligase adenylyltransferase [Rhodopirellula sp. JC740]|uniref:Glutamate-ammonia-ligase adenylyltransferase n=1 Tax=Rhodopirellula halodulae TaxID=2894198 RepID=A0ABS8NCP1_9BACT|nr:glutamate-ammonia-ligase adenylyltransferase [Rhodopirellula sp. JC740]MCC9641310.1 glutamate-ammonia-ligase adenylyltransferase [Rhodopirellula sp. JC740]